MTDERDLAADAGGSVLDFTGPATIERQAHQWMVRLDDQPCEADLQAFKLWVNQSKAHRVAFEGAVSFSGEMDVLAQIELPREQEAARRRAWAIGFPWQSFKPFAMSCCCLLIALVAVFMWQQPIHKEYTTAIGEQLTVELPDGSSVLLNTQSRLLVDYSRERRQLTLLRGEAHFDVFHNPDLPFEVYAGKGLVRAVGTAFSVRMKTRNVGVIVTEGTVEIDSVESSVSAIHPTPEPDNAAHGSGASDTPEPSLLAAGLRVRAGSQLVYDRESIATVDIAEVEQMDEQLSWHNGHLVFNGETLKQVVEEVSRYTTLKIIIPEEKTRDIRIGGIFKIGDTESFFEALERGFDIQVKEVVPNKEVHLLYRSTE